MLLLDTNSSAGAGLLSSALLGAAIAALGFVAKQFWDSWVAFGRTKRERRARLVQLQSHLRATRVSFQVQVKHAKNLLIMLKTHIPDLDESKGYAQGFAASFDGMTKPEKELLAFIRSITINALFPENAALMDWINEDTYFKAQYGRSDALGQLARQLAELQAHLILWRARFQAWIPDHPGHAIVFLADEQEYGIGFPIGIDETVASVLAII